MGDIGLSDKQLAAAAIILDLLETSEGDPPEQIAALFAGLLARVSKYGFAAGFQTGYQWAKNGGPQVDLSGYAEGGNEYLGE